MILGDIELASSYSPGSGIVLCSPVDAVIMAMDAYPSRCRIYSRADLRVYTTYTLFSAGGNRASLGPTLEGTVDRAYAPGDLLWLQCNLADVVNGGSYAAPAFAAFGIAGVSGPVEVGYTLAAATYTFNWSTSNPGNVAANSISIADTTAGTTLAAGLANTGSAAIALAAVTNNAPAAQVWTIRGVNTQGGAFARTTALAWDWRVYAGTSANATLTANQIKALADSSGLQSAFAGTYTYADNAGYKYFSYPDEMGDASDFVDANTGFPVDMATVADDAAYSHLADGWYYAIVPVTNANGATTDYRVYRTTYGFSGVFSTRVS